MRYPSGTFSAYFNQSQVNVRNSAFSGASLETRSSMESDSGSNYSSDESTSRFASSLYPDALELRRPAPVHIAARDLEAAPVQMPAPAHTAPAAQAQSAAKKGWWSRRTPMQKGFIGAAAALFAAGAGVGIWKGVSMQQAALNNHDSKPKPITEPLPSATASNSGGFTASFGGNISTRLPTTATTVPSVTATPTPFVTTSAGQVITVTPTPSAAPSTQTAAPTAKPSTPAGQALDTQGWIVSNDVANAGQFRCVFMEEAVTETNEGLKLSVLPKPVQGLPYECAQIVSKGTYEGGTFNISMQAAGHPGVVTAAFLYAEPAPGIVQEIDLEFTGLDTTKLHANVWRDGGSQEHTIDLGFDAAAAAHDYAIVWNKDSITWFADGQSKLTIKDNLPREGVPMKMYASTWISKPNGFAGSYDETQTMPEQNSLFKQIAFTE